MGTEAEAETTRTGDTEVLLNVDSVDSFYGSARALFEVSFSVPDGEVIAVIGPNGAGKSTLLDCITGFKDYSGTITYRGRSLQNTKPQELGGDIAYAMEDGNLFSDMTVLENLRLGGYTTQDALQENLESVFDLFPRLEERQDQNAKTLSGGEGRMLSIGRSLMPEPDLLILDEPSLGLAPTIVKDIKEALGQIKTNGTTMLLAEQNVNLAFDLADQILVLENGEIVIRGSPSQLEKEERIQDSYFS